MPRGWSAPAGARARATETAVAVSAALALVTTHLAAAAPTPPSPVDAAGPARSLATPVPPAPTLERARVAADSLLVGQGWGCVWTTSASGGRDWQCWGLPDPALAAKPSNANVADAKGSAGPDLPLARRVPWLRERSLRVGAPDRVCATDQPGRCWRPPTWGDTQPNELPDATPAATAGADRRTRPRARCVLSTGGRARCKGAVPSPRELLFPLSTVAVSPGEVVSACAVSSDSRVFCWGAGYSPRERPALVIEVDLVGFEPPPVNPGPATRDAGTHPAGLPWGFSCLINRPCPIAARELQPCAAAVAVAARPWQSVSSAARRLVGQVVSVRGPLATGSSVINLPLCRELDPVTAKPLRVHGCCRNVVFARVAIGGGREALNLEGFDCQGDESRQCCNVALGGEVVATGRLTRDDRFDAWQLAEPKLCLAPR